VSARVWLYLALFVLAASAVGTGYLFWVQNSGQTLTLSFEFWGVGRYGRTLTAPELMVTSVAVGFFIGFIPMFIGGLRKSRRIRQLEQQVAMGGSGDNASSWR